LTAAEWEGGTATLAEPSPAAEDDAIIAALRGQSNGDKFATLFDEGASGYSSDSEADFALAGIIRFRSQDPEQIERIMRRSKLWREKWDEPRPGGTYLTTSIENNLKKPGEVYQDPGPDLIAQAAAKAEKGGVTDSAVETEPAKPPKTVGEQTLDTLAHGPVPAQLVPPFLTADGPTVFYGRGGVGKGFVATWLALQLVRYGMRVTIIDFEGHPSEWARRARMFRFTEEERQRVNYRAPYGEDWTARTGTLAEVAAILKPDLDNPERYVDYLIIDSYTTASGSGAEMGGAAAANEFFGAIQVLGRPAAVIAHVAAAGEKFPTKPFGSIFTHNLARETWAIARNGDETDGGPIELELRNMKANDRPKSPPQFLTFTFDRDPIMGTTSVRVDTRAPVNTSLSVLAADILRRLGKPMTVKALASAIRADSEVEVDGPNLRRALKAHPDLFEETSAVPREWRMRGLRILTLPTSSRGRPRVHTRVHK
jgi:hypothetical protein